MKAHYATFEQSKLLKEKGFDNIECSGYYHICVGYKIGYAFCYSNINKQSDSVLLAPEKWQVIEWLRINHGIWVSPGIITLNGVVKWFPRYFKFANALLEIPKDIDGNFDTPQEAYSAAFDYIINNNLI